MSETNSPVTDALQKVLQNSFGLYMSTYSYHWNIEGAKFVSLHKLFEEHYTELFTAIDEIAERIRALDAYALPFEDQSILKLVNGVKNPLEEESSADKRADMMVANLIKLNEKVIDSLQKAKEAAATAKDDETEDLMIGRIKHHQDVNWMYRSVIAD